MNTDATALSPSRFAVLGYGGLLPFIGLTLLIFFGAEYRPFFSMMLVGYGAVILSFVGALHWGFAMTLQGLPAKQRQERLVWSVIPALIGWVGTLLPVPLGCLVLTFGFIGHLWQDHKLAQAVPGWYLPMRVQLTAVASLCLLISGLAVSLHF
ncbi:MULTISPECIES: DUF3429 domain-containing protein [unclassified Pseudomonas]|jgi:hypothetical protein|uniref:DUF3429 domain-containing protein n=1 Tax=Pseudomonas TaxID=286 RepID=UPI000C88C416|nr:MULTISPECIES: DUF3429 domain-containing protein [unclassified Pseudomonas]PNA87019.1 DUF3429 domain-containing protein [Pseudomonas sp. GW460-5]PNB54343.1 DUF3429 domain-containing protein [Pseudomonas sp. FW305-130]